MTTAEEIKAEYTSSLADLTFNSKPLINVLTMLAEENLPKARVIVEAIEEHLSKVQTDVKLPILYLIDCIVKNVGQTYTALFSQNIVSTFCNVFKMVDEKTRAEMFKLRQTWNDVFPQMKLYAIDVQINMIDPAWPVTAHPSNSIHLNPKFLKTTTTTAKSKLPTDTTPIIAKPVGGDIDKETLLMQEQLIQKQKELLELQRKTLELEVLQTQVKLQEQMKGAPAAPTNILLKPEVAKQLQIPQGSAKSRTTAISSSVMNQRLQNNQVTQSKINPVSPALATARPIRDPRLLRQQQLQLQQQQKAAAQLLEQKAADESSVSASIVLQKSAVLENNKNVTNKIGVRDIHKDPRFNKDRKPKSFPKSREPISASNPPVTEKIDTVSPLRKSDLSEKLSPKSNSSNNSLASSSSGSLDSPTKTGKSDKVRSPRGHKKRDKPESKGAQDFVVSNKREKVELNNDGASFKSVRNSAKNRNYIRRNLSDSPVQDEDLRSLPPLDKQPRIQPCDTNTKESSAPETPIEATNKPMDVDLRQLPAPISKKRTSTESSEQASKKSKSFDILFGNEDTDLRQIPVASPEQRPPVAPERPPTPPPPIISTNEQLIEKALPESPKKNDLEAIRAKLANATNRDKVMAKSFHRKKLQAMGDQDLRLPISGAQPNTIMISPEEEKVIKSGQMTKEQEKQILNKIFMQLEKDKLREAKKKDHEESIGNISLQPISDEEFKSDSSDEDNMRDRDERTSQIPPPAMFNDKDERLNLPHIPQTQNMENVPPSHPPQFFPRDVRRPPFRGAAPNWRGRGRGGIPQAPQQVRPPIRPWIHQQGPVWRNPPPQSHFVPQPPEFVPMVMEEEASMSPQQDFINDPPPVQEENKTLNIDGIARDIRLYNDTAVIFLNWDDPRDIGFQSGVRRVTFNNNESYLLSFGDGYKECLINGFPFRVKLGVPSREIFIDDVGYECYFGGTPITVELNGGLRVSIQLDAPVPQVKIGEVKRTDLVICKIKLIINAKLVVPVFLDAKAQKFVIDGETSTLRFVDALKTVLINDVPFKVEFGGLPKPFTIHGKKHFIRFSVLPKGVRPGFVRIRDMEGESSMSPQNDGSSQDGFIGPLDAGEPLRPDLSKVRQHAGQESPDNRSNSPSFFQNLLQPGSNNFDVISNVFSSTLAPAPTTEGYQVENIPGIAPTQPKEGTNAPNIAPPNTNTPAFNINDLFQKLVASGFVKTDTSKNQKDTIVPDVPSKVPEPKLRNGSAPQIKKPVETLPPKPVKRTLTEILKPINFSRPETLKIRQGALYGALYSGMQCSSCGMRFPPEASIFYSQHLDWHFRQNRRGKKNIRVASSRKWYYSLADWKNYEEIEDMEEREKNYFDQQQQQAEVAAEDADDDVEIPSVPADPNSMNERCKVCRDAFEQFFNEEKEEWHLRNAIKINDQTYHPVCYEDYQTSILDQTLDDSKVEEVEPSQNKLIPGLEIILDDDDDEEYEPTMLHDVVSLPESDDSRTLDEILEEKKEESLEEEEDDDDVILNEVAPIKIVVDDDDDEDQPMDGKSDDKHPVKVKKERHVDDDGFVDVGEGLVSLNKVGQIKIKSEPMDEDENNLPSSDKTRLDLTGPDLDQTQPEPITQPEIVTSHPEFMSSMDGNMELDSSTPIAVPTSLASGARIKINISKPLPVINQNEGGENCESALGTSVSISESVSEEPEITRYKPGLEKVPLKKLPPVKKGTELTGMCSIM